MQTINVLALATSIWICLNMSAELAHLFAELAQAPPPTNAPAATGAITVFCTEEPVCAILTIINKTLTPQILDA